MIHFFMALVFFIAFSSSQVHANPSAISTYQLAAQKLKLDQHPQWLALLHYKKNFWGSLKSQADGRSFFLASDGDHNLANEMAADIAAFFQPPLVENSPARQQNNYQNNQQATPAPQHPQCQFPARFAWLNQQLHFDQNLLPKIECPRYQNFRKRIQAQSASVVFSSYYLNNPASAFGHTLLKLNQNLPGQKDSLALLDYGISYAASVTISNPILYAIYGIFGLFPGSFTSVPYYYKVREYNDYESRDLWEYELNLTAAQTQLMVAHLWELGSTYFDYYYLSENCSYHVLSILETANPELHLTDRVRPIIIPSDTVRLLVETPGLVRAIHYRPSTRVQFFSRLNQLSESEKTELKKYIKNPQTVNPTNIAVHDAALDYFDFKNARKLYDADQSTLERKQIFLEKRAAITQASPTLTVATPENEQPHLGHRSARVFLGHGYYLNSKSNAVTLGFRLALHDLLDAPIGYPEFSHIEFLPTKLTYQFEAKNFIIDMISAVRVASYTPISSFDKPWSWRANFGAKTIRDLSCDHCLSGVVEVAGGYTVELLKNIYGIGLLEAYSNIAPKFSPFFARVGAGPSLALLLRWGTRFSLMPAIKYHWQTPANVWHKHEFEAEGRYTFSTALALGLQAQHFRDGWNFNSLLYWYL